MEHIKTNDTVYFTANFYHPTSGFSYAADSLPTWRVYKDNATTAMSGNVMTARTDIAGSYFGSFGATLNNGFITNSFYDVQVSGSVSGLSAFTSVKQFVLNDIFDANIVQVSGEAFGIMVGSIDANIVKVSGESVSIADFGGGTGASASELWGYANRSLTTAVSVSGIPQVNLIQVSGEYVNIGSFGGGDGGSLTAQAVRAELDANSVMLASISGNMVTQQQVYTQASGALVNYDVVNYNDLLARSLAAADYFDFTTDTVMANMIEINGVAASGTGTVNANIVQVSGEYVNIGSFGGGTGASASELWGYANRSLTTAVSVSGIVQSNVVQVSGVSIVYSATRGLAGTALPDALPGAAGGVLIAGTNAPVTIAGTGTALTLTSTGSNGNGMLLQGNGTGAGLRANAGVGIGSAGIYAAGSASAGMGVYAEGPVAGIAANGTTADFGGDLLGSVSSVVNPVSVSGVVQSNIIQVSGATITPTVLPKVNMVQVSGQFVNTNSFQTTATNIRTAVGLNTASLNTQLVNISGYVDCLPVSWITPLDSGGLRGAIGLSSANLDSQLTGLSGDLVTANTAVYFANVKYVRDNINSQDEYSVVWFKNDQPVQSGSLTSPAISVFNTSTGAAVVNNQKMSYASPNLGVVRYNATSSLLGSGEPYLVGVSGVIDSTVRTWRTIIGIDAF